MARLAMGLCLLHNADELAAFADADASLDGRGNDCRPCCPEIARRRAMALSGQSRQREVDQFLFAGLSTPSDNRLILGLLGQKEDMCNTGATDRAPRFASGCAPRNT